MAETEKALARVASVDEKMKAALLKFQDAHPEEGKSLVAYIQNVEQHNVMALGENEVFALRDANGDIRAFRQRVQLSQRGAFRHADGSKWQNNRI